MGLRSIMVVCFKVLVLVIQIYGSQCCVREEREALLSIKAHLLQTEFDDPFSSWVNHSYSDCCKWNGVTCHRHSGRVSTILISSEDIYITPKCYTIDCSLFQNFQHLTTLNFSQLFSCANLVNSQELCGLKKIRVLDLSTNQFHGTLPNCLANLTSLEALDISYNYLSGEIPVSAIASLTSLEYLSLMFNNFQGSFPLSSFANNSKLNVLTLEMNNNDFQVDTEIESVPSWVPLFQLQVLHMPKCKVNLGKSGIFPSFLFYQHDLQYLDLSNNNLKGVFPNWLILNNTNLTSLFLHQNSFTGPFGLPLTNTIYPLVDLQLSDNKMEGKLPKEIGQMFPKLESFNVSRNGFHGEIPASLGNMSELSMLDLSRNYFSGEIPGSLWTDLASSLCYLKFSHNNLRGQPFSSSTLNFSFVDLFNLVLLFLDNNNLSGPIENSTVLWQLPVLEALDISNNYFWGTLTSIGDSSRLFSINLSGNNLTGTLPVALCTHDGLKYLHLSHNKFSGSIPSCYFNMTNLLSLYMQGNSLEGSIPTLGSSITSLLTLDLRDNNLSGHIPDSIFRLSENLTALLLGGNQLQGQIPHQLCRLNIVGFLDLSRNNFTGNIPSCSYNFSFRGSDDLDPMLFGELAISSTYWYDHLNLSIYMDRTYYYTAELDDGIDVEFRTKDSSRLYKGNILRFMTGIDLSCNHFTGEIPHQIGSLPLLRALNLSHNHFHGFIPSSFGNLTSIESLDLSYNKLNGEIPLQLQNLNSLEVFNVSYNNLSGTVPSIKQFGTFDQSSFLGNPYLHVKNSNRGNSKPVMQPPSTFSNNDKEDDSMIDFTSFIWSFGASYVAVLVILVTILWINPYWRKLWFYYIETCLYRCLYPYLKDAFY